MKPDEVKKAMTKLGGMFPGQFTQEQGKLLAKEFAGLSFAAVCKAIDQHRMNPELKDGFMHVGKLLEGCRAAEHEAEFGPRIAQREQTWCDVQRRLHPQLAQAGDLEVILRVHRQWAVRAAGGDDFTQMSDGNRKMIETSCKSQLMAIAYDPGEEPTAQQSAQTSVWIDEMAEWVWVSVEDFRRMLDDVRGDLALSSAAASSPL